MNKLIHKFFFVFFIVLGAVAFASCGDDDDDDDFDLPEIEEGQVLVFNGSKYNLSGLQMHMDTDDGPHKQTLNLLPGEYAIVTPYPAPDYYFSIYGEKQGRVYFSKSYKMTATKCILTSDIVGNWKTEGTHVYYYRDEFVED